MRKIVLLAAVAAGTALFGTSDTAEANYQRSGFSLQLGSGYYPGGYYYGSPSYYYTPRYYSYSYPYSSYYGGYGYGGYGYSGYPYYGYSYSPGFSLRIGRGWGGRGWGGRGWGGRGWGSYSYRPGYGRGYYRW